MNDDDRFDLSALDPAADSSRVDRSARVISARVAPSLRRRRERAPALWIELAEWRRPALAVAALLVTASIVVLVVPRSPSVSVASAGPSTLAEAAGVPPFAAGWLESATPTSDAVLLDVREAP